MVEINSSFLSLIDKSKLCSDLLFSKNKTSSNNSKYLLKLFIDFGYLLSIILFRISCPPFITLFLILSFDNSLSIAIYIIDILKPIFFAFLIILNIPKPENVDSKLKSVLSPIHYSISLNAFLPASI